MENVIQRYLNFSEIEKFMAFLKISANSLCLINDDYNESCSVHRFLINAESEIKEVPWEEKINVFFRFCKKMKKFL